MKAKFLSAAGYFYIGFSALALGFVSLLSIADPQETMNLVQVQLGNNDAISSIRGIYGGVGLAIVISLLYLMFRDLKLGIIFLVMFWGFYALSRLMTIQMDGALGDFGNQWIVTESVMCVFGMLLLIFSKK